MFYPLSSQAKMIAMLTIAVLLTTVANAKSRIFLHSDPRNSHISGIYALYTIDKDTGWLRPADERMRSKYVRRERNSDLAIVVPNPRGRYKIRFLDQQDQFLFEIRQIRDSLLIVEKVNFRHAGLFQYELYKDNALVERNIFIIKSTP
jgi:hypothetical protein